ncbi:MAG: class I SAM-dependent methyltransferase [Opitutae bacterium]|nr:class I SAM-dependent methyltransferase [Opitutae bacterium]
MITPPANSFTWAGERNCKELILALAPPYLVGRDVRRIMDFACGTCEEIATLAPHAQEYHFLDSHFLPAERPRYHLHRQPASHRINLPDDYLDVVTSNGSFDHFRQADRIAAFLEIERVLKPGGVFLFACEYFDYDTPDFFARTQADADMVARNCAAYDNIDLHEICARLTRLRIVQDDKSMLPRGQPLSQLVTTAATRIHTQPSACGLWVTWGAFFVAFAKVDSSLS